MKNPQSDLCLDTLGKNENNAIGLFACHGQGGNQVDNILLMNIYEKNS